MTRVLVTGVRGTSTFAGSCTGSRPLFRTSSGRAPATWSPSPPSAPTRRRRVRARRQHHRPRGPGGDACLPRSVDLTGCHRQGGVLRARPAVRRRRERDRGQAGAAALTTCCRGLRASAARTALRARAHVSSGPVHGAGCPIPGNPIGTTRHVHVTTVPRPPSHRTDPRTVCDRRPPAVGAESPLLAVGSVDELLSRVSTAAMARRAHRVDGRLTDGGAQRVQ